MKRGKSILVVCHCLLNANAIVPPLAEYPGVKRDVLGPYIEEGCGLLQLPCPETSYLGLNRWGMTQEQYDCPGYREHCRRILKTPLLEIRSFLMAGYEIKGIMGVEGSPTCGVWTTCYGYTGGEISLDRLPGQIENLRMAPGTGVFIEVLEKLLEEEGIELPFLR